MRPSHDDVGGVWKLSEIAARLASGDVVASGRPHTEAAGGPMQKGDQRDGWH